MASNSTQQGSEENCETEEANSPNISVNMSSETHTHATRLRTGSISPKGFANKRRKYKTYKYYSKKTVPDVEQSAVINKSNHCHVQNNNSKIDNEDELRDSLQSEKELCGNLETEMNGSVSSGSEDSALVSKSDKNKESGKDETSLSLNSDHVGVKKTKSEDEDEKDENSNEMSIEDSEEKSPRNLTKEMRDHSADHTAESKDSEKIPQPKESLKTNDSKRQTIIVTETKSLAQVINNAVRKDKGSSQEGKPTLVIIETKTPSELGSVPKTQSVTNTITVETGVGKTSSSSLAPISLNSVTVTPSHVKSITTSSNGNAASLSSSVIEDGGMAVEVPSLVVPYLIEYPPSRTISEFLKMLPLDAKELREIEEASKNKLFSVANSSSLGSSSNAYNYGNPIGRPKTSDRWGAYFENSLGRFFVDIGLSLAKEWVQTDLVKSQKRKTEKEGKSPQNDLNMESLIKTLAETKDKNEPFHFPLKKCEYCNFKTESILIMKNHYNYPHEKHLDYRCNFCKYRTRVAQDIKFHMEAEHGLQAKLEKPHCFYHCPLCEFEDNSKAKVTKHSMKCQKKFIPDKNLAPPPEFDPPAKRPKVYPIIPPGMPMQMSTNKYNPSIQTYASKSKISIKPKDTKLSISTQQGPYRQLTNSMGSLYYRSSNVVYPQQSVNRSSIAQPSVYLPSNQSLVVNQMLSSSQQYQSNQIYQVVNSPNQFMPVVGGNLGQMGNPRFTILPTASSNNSSMQGPTPVALVPNIATAAPSRSVMMGNMSASQRLQTPKPNISITPVTKSSSVLQSRTRFPLPSTSMPKLSGQNTSSFVVCEICDGYIKDLEQLRTHMQWIHKVKIHPKMIFNRPPLNCQKCQFRFFTDQGLERHLLGAHGLVTSSMQENANKGQDSGRCTICGKVFQWKLLAHMSKDHNMILKPAHLSYKCTVCAATFGMYKLFETHVYQAHSTVAKRVLDTPDEKKAKSPLQIAKSSDFKPTPPPLLLECSECDQTFSKKVNYYQHWEKEHLNACYVKLCRIDKCEKCLSAFTGKTPWSVEEESSSEEEKIMDKEADVVTDEVTLESSNNLNCRITDDTATVSSKLEINTKQDEAVLDMDVVEGHDGIDSTGIDDEETALDMEVESHDVDHPSPDSVHTDEDDDC